MTAISDDQLDERTRLSDSTAPGPWTHATETDESEGLGNPAELSEWEMVTTGGQPNVILASEMDLADTRFVVAARTYVPLLVEEIRRLRA